jgi:hypothetical protein
MYIIPIGWLYVALMMSVAEANNSNGTVLGAVITFVFYGLLPVGLILYFMGSPGRRRAIKAKEVADLAATQTSNSGEPDAGSLPTADPVTPVRKEP